MESVYEVNAEGRLNFVTVLFPHNGTHQKPPISRITELGLSGCIVVHENQTRDVILESAGDQDIAYDNITFNGKALVSRGDNSTNTFYFVGNGLRFERDGTEFESDAEISIYAKGNEGVIVSDGAKIKLNGQAMGSINFVPSVDIINSGDTFIEMQAPDGMVRFAPK